MPNNVVFNITVCIIGIVILLVHVATILTKKSRRKDETALLVFLSFTVGHFALYLTFTLIKQVYTSDPFIMGFYTAFYIANNLEVFFLFLYTMVYVDLHAFYRKPLQIVNVVLLIVFVGLDLSNIFTHIFFSSVDGVYTRSPLMFLCQIYQFVMLGIVFVISLINKNLNIREKVAYTLYCVFPLVAIILQNFFPGFAIAYLSIILSIEILFFFLNVERNLKLAKEEEKAKDAQIAIMLSQIQPHFIYNSLSSISTLIPIDPEKAQKALDDFTEYLRMNLSTLTASKLIPFEDELRHIKTFLSLEKTRFNNRLNIVYELGPTDFDLPPLSIQPLVENAVKHGILKKVEGGTVILKTSETPNDYVIEVIDDGVGFAMEGVDFDHNEHLGLKNIAYRISRSGGKLNIESKPGQGCKATVTFKK